MAVEKDDQPNQLKTVYPNRTQKTQPYEFEILPMFTIDLRLSFPEQTWTNKHLYKKENF